MTSHGTSVVLIRSIAGERVGVTPREEGGDVYLKKWELGGSVSM